MHTHHKTFMKVYLLMMITLLMISCKKNNENLDINYVGKIIESKNYKIVIKLENNITLKENEKILMRTGGNLAVMKIISTTGSTAIADWAIGYNGYSERLEIGMPVYRYDESYKEKAIVTTDILRIRQHPDEKSTIVGKLEKGNIITILSKTKNDTEIQGINDKWYNISYNELNGWVFGGFITKDYIEIKDTSKIAWIKVNNSTMLNDLIIFDLKDKSVISLEICLDTTWAKFSDQMKYVAIDCGTDIMGSIEIYNVESKKIVYNTTYTRHNLKWEGNKISIESLNISDCKTSKNGQIPWNEIIFDDGIIKKGNNKGEMACQNL